MTDTYRAIIYRFDRFLFFASKQAAHKAQRPDRFNTVHVLFKTFLLSKPKRGGGVSFCFHLVVYDLIQPRGGLESQQDEIS